MGAWWSLRTSRNCIRRAARTYPVGAEALARAIEAAIRDLPRWELARSSEEEIRAVRRTRLGFGDDVTVRLVPLESGDHTNTHAKIESRSHVSLWDLGQNKRNLKELLGAVNENLIPETDAS